MHFILQQKKGLKSDYTRWKAASCQWRAAKPRGKQSATAWRLRLWKAACDCVEALFVELLFSPPLHHYTFTLAAPLPYTEHLMSDVVIRVENLSKKYRLGLINHGMLSKDLQSWWAKKRGKDDPNGMVESDQRSRGGQQVASGDLNSSTQSQTALHLSTGEQGSPTSTDEIYALRGINFEVRQGEVLGIIGANGAGKSTLLKILSRVTAPTTGSIKIKGRIGSLLEVGTGFHPELTGRENIYLNGAILGMRSWEIDKKLDEIIDFSGVEKFIDTPVKRYSSGMYVRLAFAVAAHLDPEILVVDEVLAVGDAEFQKKCLGKMGDISKKDGRTVLFVSHNMAAVQQLCVKGLVLSKGGIVYNGSAIEAINKYIGMSDKSQKYDSDGFVSLNQSREKIYQDKIFKRIRLLDKNNRPCETFKMLDSVKRTILEVKKAENIGQLSNCEELVGYKSIYRLRIGDLRAFFFCI